MANLMTTFYVTVDNSDAYIHPLVAIFYVYPLDDFTSLHFTSFHNRQFVGTCKRYDIKIYTAIFRCAYGMASCNGKANSVMTSLH